MPGFTLQQLEKLEEAIAQGALEVQYADKRVRYESMAAMLRLRTLMQEELGIIEPSRRRVYATFNKGLNNNTNEHH
jgi:hypothetical protein